MTGSAEKAAPRPANKRGAARLAAVQALYQMELSGASVLEIVAEYEANRLGRELDGETYLEADPDWFRAIVSGVVKEQRAIDPPVHSALPPTWPLARIDTLLRAILRAGAYELLFRRDVPGRVAISEYVDVAKAFYEDEEPGLVNAVLDRIARERREQEMTGGGKPDHGAPKE
jgi:N utilization substance protein B